ncbi:MAG TPA: hypothetical protein VGL12_13515 [Roseiarcus sp.]|jgi:hypothetical protein
MRNSTWKAVTVSFAAVALVVSLGTSSPVLARGGGGGGGHGGGGFGGGHSFGGGGFRAGGGHAFAGGGFHDGRGFHEGREGRHRFHGNGGFDNYNACVVSPFYLFGDPTYPYSC